MSTLTVVVIVVVVVVLLALVPWREPGVTTAPVIPG